MIPGGTKIFQRFSRFSKLSSPDSRWSRSISTIQNDSQNRWFRISFNDGTTGIFPYVWLRDTSLDPATYSITDSMKARNLMMRDFDVEVTPESFDFDKTKNALMISWPGSVHSM